MCRQLVASEVDSISCNWYSFIEQGSKESLYVTHIEPKSTYSNHSLSDVCTYLSPYLIVQSTKYKVPNGTKE